MDVKNIPGDEGLWAELLRCLERNAVSPTDAEPRGAIVPIPWRRRDDHRGAHDATHRDDEFSHRVAAENGREAGLAALSVRSLSGAQPGCYDGPYLEHTISSGGNAHVACRNDHTSDHQAQAG